MRGNIGTGKVDDARVHQRQDRRVVAEKTVSLEPLGTGAAAQPCVTTAAEAVGAPVNAPASSSSGHHK
jgi:hypothetical protein